MAEDTEVPTGGRAAAEVREVADVIRSRLDLFGKSLAGIATVGTGAVGLAKVSDLFPTSGDNDLAWAFVAVALLAAAGGGAVGIAVRLMRASDSVVVEADLSQSDLRSDRERPDVERIFAASAARFGFSSLLGLQERERVLRKAAARALDDDARKSRTALADEVKTEIEQALARAQLSVVRRRATRAVGGPGAMFLYAAVIIGLLGFAMSADYVTSSRSDAIKIAEDCAKAREAKATAEDLARSDCEPKAADKEPEKPTPKPTMAELRADLATQLMDVYKSCVKTAATKDTSAQRGEFRQKNCAPLSAVVQGLLQQ